MSQKNISEYSEEDMTKYDWINLNKDMDAVRNSETFSEKFSRKFSENPFVPIGCLATSAALCYGIWSFRTGQRKMSQYMMRTRVVAQGLTVLAMVMGIIMGVRKTSK